jgi:phosphoribosylaminoimidazole-succinocarboxamide synthase
MSSPVVLETNLAGLPLLRRGKVRDVYDLGEHLLIVATDRISAFDCVLATGIADKGRVLTQLSAFWFRQLADLSPHHLVSVDADDFPAAARPHRVVLEGRSMLVRKTEPLPVECVARGYLSGSGWKEYLQTGAVCGVALPAGLQESGRLAEPIFTPATKAQTGHDENISEAAVAGIVGRSVAADLRQRTLAIYARAVQHAETCGIIIADTKFEFGFHGRELLLIDEALTPDSSRFWPRAEYRPGRSQASFDKQFVRDYLERIGWNKQPPAPSLPDDVVSATRAKYRDAYRVLTGHDLD